MSNGLAEYRKKKKLLYDLGKKLELNPKKLAGYRIIDFVVKNILVDVANPDQIDMIPGFFRLRMKLTNRNKRKINKPNSNAIEPRPRPPRPKPSVRNLMGDDYEGMNFYGSYSRHNRSGRELGDNLQRSRLLDIGSHTEIQPNVPFDIQQSESQLFDMAIKASLEEYANSSEETSALKEPDDSPGQILLGGCDPSDDENKPNESIKIKPIKIEPKEDFDVYEGISTPKRTLVQFYTEPLIEYTLYVCIDLRIYGPNPYLPIHVEDQEYYLNEKQIVQVTKLWNKIDPDVGAGLKYKQNFDYQKSLSIDGNYGLET